MDDWILVIIVVVAVIHVTDRILDKISMPMERFVERATVFMSSVGPATTEQSSVLTRTMNDIVSRLDQHNLLIREQTAVLERSIAELAEVTAGDDMFDDDDDADDEDEVEDDEDMADEDASSQTRDGDADTSQDGGGDDDDDDFVELISNKETLLEPFADQTGVEHENTIVTIVASDYSDGLKHAMALVKDLCPYHVFRYNDGVKDPKATAFFDFRNTMDVVNLNETKATRIKTAESAALVFLTANLNKSFKKIQQLVSKLEIGDSHAAAVIVVTKTDGFLVLDPSFRKLGFWGENQKRYLAGVVVRPKKPVVVSSDLAKAAPGLASFMGKSGPNNLDAVVEYALRDVAKDSPLFTGTVCAFDELGTDESGGVTLRFVS